MYSGTHKNWWISTLSCFVHCEDRGLPCVKTHCFTHKVMCLSSIYSQNNCSLARINHTDNAAQAACTPAERAARTVLHQTALVAALAALFTHTHTHTSEIQLTSPKWCECRCTFSRLKSDPYRRVRKTFIRCARCRERKRGNVQPRTSERAIWADAGYPSC